MYTAVITKKNIVLDNLEVLVTFSDGVRSFKKLYKLNDQRTNTWLQQEITRELERQEALETYAQGIALGTVTRFSGTAIEGTAILE